MKYYSFQVLITLVILLFESNCSQKDTQPWILFETESGEFGYMNLQGDTVIAAGKYVMCFTDTIKTFGIVTDKELGIIGINQAGEILFNVFNYDNGPDYISEGLFRIVEDGKIGYANQTGNIMIKPE